MAEQIKGLKELNKQLKQLGEAAGTKALRGAVGFALTPVVNLAKQNIPKGTEAHKTYKGRLVAPGFSSRNIFKKTRVDKQTGTVKGSIGAKDEAFYAVNFVEIGTSKMAARPWLRPSFKIKRREMISRFGAKLKKGIEKAVKK